MVTARIPISLSSKYIKSQKAQLKPHMTSNITRRQNTTNFKVPASGEINTKIQESSHCLCKPGSLTQEKGHLKRRDQRTQMTHRQNHPQKREVQHQMSKYPTLEFGSWHHQWHRKRLKDKSNKNASSNKQHFWGRSRLIEKRGVP